MSRESVVERIKAVHSMETPKTLQQAFIHFSKPENCNAFMIQMRWPDGQVQCPTCGAEKVTYLAKANVYKCYEKHPRAKFSLKVGTIFEDSPLGLDKWLTAIWMIANAKNGISSYELSRHFGNRSEVRLASSPPHPVSNAERQH